MARPGQGHGGQDPASGRTLGFFLQCNGENESNTWNIHASAELSIVNQASPEKTQPRSEPIISQMRKSCILGAGVDCLFV